MIKPSRKRPKLKTYIDLFCGIGGFHVAASRLGMKCVFASDIDEHARQAYQHNYGLLPHGDITQVKASDVPDHDVLFAGFPCQPFSIIGAGKGFDDPRGTLFFEILRIAKAKKPQVLVLENVRQLATRDNGDTINSIQAALESIGYTVEWKILNALDFGLPQKRDRVIIIASRKKLNFQWPTSLPRAKLKDVLEKKPGSKHFVSAAIRQRCAREHVAPYKPMIWHTNKSGNISSHPHSCALRANASYNYLLVDGKRRLTPREMLRLQGFPEEFEIVCSDCQTRKQAGNAVPVPMVEAVITEVQHANK